MTNSPAFVKGQIEGADSSAPFVLMKGICKNFPNVRAVDDGFVEIFPHEIYSVIGENGAGKSTLMKILYGIYTPDSGTIEIRGKIQHSYNTHDAIKMGIGMVHQEFMLVNELTVFENIVLGFEPVKSFGRLDFAAAMQKIENFMQNYNLPVQLNKQVRNVSVGERQRVEIIKALYRGADVLILDEPTAVLTPQESEQLFAVLKSMKNDGKTIIFISHKLGEIMEISDRITVMRRGKYIKTLNKKDTDKVELANLMIGREMVTEARKRAKKRESDEKILEIEHLYVAADRELSTIRDMSFDILKGEILGVAGVDGNGQSELVEALVGLREIQGGSVKLNGESIIGLSPDKIRGRGISHIPDDRNVRGLNKEFTIADNLVACRVSEKKFSPFGVLNNENITLNAQMLIEKFDIRPDNPCIVVGTLSGGNAQKIVVAREIDACGGLLVACQPTRGVDIGAIQSIREILLDAKDKGLSILLVSTDLDEIMSVSDRIIVMHEGEITGELLNENVDIENLGLLMMGGKKPNETGI